MVFYRFFLFYLRKDFVIMLQYVAGVLPEKQQMYLRHCIRWCFFQRFGKHNSYGECIIKCRKSTYIYGIIAVSQSFKDRADVYSAHAQ